MNESLAPLNAVAPERSQKAAQSYLVCVLETACLGIEALAVREITPLPMWTPVLGASPLIAGVVDVRGEYVPVVDIAVALQLPTRAPQRNDVLVIIERGLETAAIVVHEVRDVQPLDVRAGELAATEYGRNSGAFSGSAASFVAGLATLDKTTVQLLRLDSILDSRRFAIAATLSPEHATAQDRAVFETRARNLAATEQAAHAESSLELAVITLDGEHFGLELAFVREFAPLRAVTPVPRAPSHILGLINLRGETLPLIDPRLALGLPPVPRGEDFLPQAEHIVVVECDGLRAGLVVDAVMDVRRIAAATLSPHAPRDERDPLRSTCLSDDGLLGVLDVTVLLAGNLASE